MNESKKQPKRLFSVDITRTTNLRVLVLARDEGEAERIAEDHDLADDADEMHSYDDVEGAEEIMEENSLYGSLAYDADSEEWLIAPWEEDTP